MAFKYTTVVCLLALLIIVSASERKRIKIADENSNFQIGAGIYDITGPPGEGQTTSGVHIRLRARAFVFADPTTQKRFVYVSTDSCMIFTSVKNTVVDRLQALYGDLYTQDNVMLSGTHTHAGPAGYAYYALYNLMSLGFQAKNFETIVNGIVQAIVQAHTNLSTGGKVYVNVAELLDSNVNRSPTSYLSNPASERANYNYDVDKIMTVLRLEDETGKELGMINWFAVHGTSMTNTNQYISGDNKGYASYLFEKNKNGNNSLPGMGPFVAAFGQSNEGDVSPNTRGAFCDNGDPCTDVSSTCGGRSENCHGYGPGVNEFDSTKIIGTNQFQKALDLYTSANTLLTGTLDYIHTFVDMENVTVDAQWTSTGAVETTCMAALGDSFAAGTTDGPGDFDFTQGTNSTSTNPYWNFLAEFISDPTQEQRECQYPKPILLNTGGASFPAKWTAAILPLQIFRLGQLVIIGVPGEFTTMSGRRLRNTVFQTLAKYGQADENTVVVIAGLANAYSHYIATYEEYVDQRYEAASTLYGPHTLAAYQQLYSQMAAAMAQGQKYPAGPNPPNLANHTFNFDGVQLPDFVPIGKSFGDMYQDVNAKYGLNDTVVAIFYGGQPNNDYRTQNTYLTVEKLGTNNEWSVMLVDGDWDTKFWWQRHDILGNLITVTWNIGLDTPAGTYRIRHFGASMDLFKKITPYSGTSSTFTVVV